MIFTKLPWDSQHCKLQIGSYMYDATEVRLQWVDVKTGLAGLGLDGTLIGVTSGEWEVARVSVWDEEVVYTYPSGDIPYNYGTVCITIQRNSIQIALLGIMMGGMLVLAAYTGFYIPPGVAPARVALGFLCFMMVLNNINATVNKFPPLLSYQRVWMIDFMLALMVLNFTALMEFGVVTYALEAQKKIGEILEKQKAAAAPPAKPPGGGGQPGRSAKVAPSTKPRPPPGPP